MAPRNWTIPSRLLLSAVDLRATTFVHMSIVLVLGGLLLAATLAGIARYERSAANEHLPGSRPGGPRDMVPHGAGRAEKAAAVGEALARAIETSQTGFVQR